MVPLCSFDPFISTRVQGFWSPLLAVPFGRLSLHPSLFLPPNQPLPLLPPLPSFYRNVSFYHSHYPLCPLLFPFLLSDFGKQF